MRLRERGGKQCCARCQDGHADSHSSFFSRSPWTLKREMPLINSARGEGGEEAREPTRRPQRRLRTRAPGHCRHTPKVDFAIVVVVKDVNDALHQWVLREGGRARGLE